MPSERSALWMRRLPVIISIGAVILLALVLLPALQQTREAARRTQSKNNLKQIGLALHNYHDTYRQFPFGGTFDQDGLGYHSWTTSLAPYLAQTAFGNLIDDKVPWDDPINVDLFRHWQFELTWLNPSIADKKSPDEFPLTHYTANQWVMNRNSLLRLEDLQTAASGTALVGDANGTYQPLGYPYQWRDLSAGFGEPAAQFGCPTRDVTMFLMADGNVQTLSNKLAPSLVTSLQGPDGLKPTAAQVAKPTEPYRLPVRPNWKFGGRVRGHKSLMTFRLTPDGKLLKVDFGNYDSPEEADSKHWMGLLQGMIADSAVEHVELRGRLRASELLPFLDLRTLKRLTVSGAQVDDDKAGTLAKARPGLVID